MPRTLAGWHKHRAPASASASAPVPALAPTPEPQPCMTWSAPPGTVAMPLTSPHQA